MRVRRKPLAVPIAIPCRGGIELIHQPLSIIQIRIMPREHTIDPPFHNRITRGHIGAGLDTGLKLHPCPALKGSWSDIRVA